MSFGVTGTAISRTTNNTVQRADKLSSVGTITDMTTHGGVTEVTEETYADAVSNTALNGQNGASDIITAHNFVESNQDYMRETVTKATALAAPTT